MSEDSGGLTYRVADALPEGATPVLVVILCHGFGAPGTDLVPIAGELIRINADLKDRVRFVFPEGPLSLDEFGMYGGRAWWQLDVARFMAAVDSGEFRNLRHETPPGLSAARELLMGLTDKVKHETGLPESRIVLGGFSQGAMLAIDVSLRLAEPPAAVAVFSGSLLCEEEWQELAKKRRGLKVVQSHGRQDPILPYLAAEWLRDMLRDAGLEVDFLAFDGMHTIPLEALDRFADLLGRLSGGE